jgi:hypothetical protein
VTFSTELNEQLTELAASLDEMQPAFNRKNKNKKFLSLVAKLKKNKSVKDPEALAYTIGLRKMGAKGGEMAGKELTGWARVKQGVGQITRAVRSLAASGGDQKKKKKSK